jgi:chemotaxis protein MotC
MTLRRMAIIVVGTLAVATAGAGYVAERSGIDLTLVADKLVAQARQQYEAMRSAPADTHSSQTESASLKPATKGDRPAEMHSDTMPNPPADAQQVREVKIGRDVQEAEPSARLPAAEHDPANHNSGSHNSGDSERQQAHDSNVPSEMAAGEHGGESVGAARQFDTRPYRLPPGERQPWRVFRRLQWAQDRIVRGEPGSLQAYRNEMTRACDEMLALPAQTWTHRRNVISAAAYVMAGGKPELAQHVLALKEVDAEARDLLAGALAYAQGQYYRAYNLLYHVDPQELPISVAGQVALVKAMLMSPRDVKRAAAFLDQARQLAPGTLVEEAALRRIIRIKAEAEEDGAFFESAKAYARRFPRSVFLSDFLRNFAFGSLRLPDQNSGHLTRAIDDIAQRIDTDARLFLYSLLARGATVYGKFDLAREISKRSLDLAGNDPRLIQRLKLYLAASSLTQPGLIGEAKTQLDGVETGMLDANDTRLLEAARTIVEEILKPLNEAGMDLPNEPDAGSVHSKDGGGTDSMTVSGIEAEPLLPVLERSRALLALADEAQDW